VKNLVSQGQLVSMADEIVVHLDAIAPYRDKIIQLAKHFDLDGTLKIVGNFERYRDCLQ